MNWVGGEHEFILRLGEVRKLQETCKAGPEQILTRLHNGNYMVDDMIEPIRLGLIGSGAMKNAEAGPLVTKLFDQHPYIQFKLPATAIMTALLFGAPEDDKPEKSKGETQPPRTETENGSSVRSTEPEA